MRLLDLFKSIDLITGGFPCQPFSLAGKRGGRDDERYLWEEMLRIVTEIKPRWCIGENVIGLLYMGLDEVLSSLENINYKTESFIIPACSVGGYHRRDRIWIIAYPNEQSLFHVEYGFTKNEREEKPKIGNINRFKFELDFGDLAPSKWKSEGQLDSQSLFLRNDDGIPSRVDRLKSLGNAIVPQVAQVIMQAIKEIIERR